MRIEMKQMEAKKMMTLAATAVVLAGLVVPSALAQAPVQQIAAVKPVAAQTTSVVAKKNAEEEEENEAPKKPGVEGIKVHGDWVIDVHNADGSLAEHRAFKNSLYQDQGQNLLMYLLSGQLTPSTLAIGVFNTSPFGLGSQVNTNDGYYLVPSNVSNAANLCGLRILALVVPCVKTETVTLTPATTSSGIFGNTMLSPGKLVLQGQVAPTKDITINSVQTLMVGCHQTSYTGSSNIDPITCGTGTLQTGATDFLQFTGTSVPALPVLAGQYVIVSVTLSFS